MTTAVSPNAPAAGGEDKAADDRVLRVADQYVPQLLLSDIIESPHNPRKRFDESKLRELAETIRDRGIHTPVIVRPVLATPHHIPTRVFELAAGHRRCRAARMLGLQHVPAIIKELTDREHLELLHLDNLQREDVDPLDEALGYEQLLAQGYDVGGLALKLGRSVSYVAARLRLLTLGSAVREAMSRGYVKLSHAIELAKLPEATQREVLQQQWNLHVGNLEAAARGDALEVDAWTEDDAETDGEEHFVGAPDDFAFRRNRWRLITEPSLAELRHALKVDVYRKLSVVPWALDDATLLPEAGACTTCEKRSGYAPMLFEELDAESEACLDAKCYDEKGETFYELQRSRRVMRSVDGPAGGPSDSDDDAAPSRPEDDWQEKNRKEAARQKREKEKRQRGRDAAVRALMAGVPTMALEDNEWLAALVVAILEELHIEGLSAAIKWFQLDTSPPKGDSASGIGWRRDRLRAWLLDEERTAAELEQALFVCALGDEHTISTYNASAKPTRLLRFAELAKVDVVSIAKAAEKAKEEKPAPKRRGKNAAAGDDADDQPAEAPAKRGRGRPKKVVE